MTRPQDDQTEPDAELMAYVDGALSPEEAARVEGRLLADHDLRLKVEAWRRQRDLVAEAARQADALPDNLRILALERELARRLQARRRRAIVLGPQLRQFAAGIAIFAAGWASHALLQTPDRLLAQGYPGYVDMALSAHLAELHPPQAMVRFDGEDIEAALAWMSDQMQMQIESPRLDRLGYRVISARLETGGEVPVAHFVYRNAQDDPVTVSIAPHPEGKPAHKLRVARAGDHGLAYWSEGAFDYSVLAAADPALLTSLAAAVRN